jgi:hypothetical protein
MNFDEYSLTLSRAYRRFQDKKSLESNGIVPNLPKHMGGYLVAFRFPQEVGDRVAAFSEGVNSIVSSVTYDRLNALMSISTMDESYSFRPEDSVLERLCDAVRLAVGSWDRSAYTDFCIDYCSWLMNQNRGIAAGFPGRKLYARMNSIVDYVNASSKGTEEFPAIHLEFPKMCHMTVARFKEKAEDRAVKDLIAYFDSSEPLGACRPNRIEVGHFSQSLKKFEFTMYDSFGINDRWP